MQSKHEYDAIIIGAGIGGLVCGCYLAKAGMKTLIVEKNAKAGGYCTSFTRNGFRFDACVHFLGSLRDDGILNKVMHDLDLKNHIKIARNPISDIIFSKDYNFSFYNEMDKTINELQYYFPSEKKSIKKFFYYISKIKGYDFSELRQKTLQEVLNHYFNNDHLKTLLGFPILGNTGILPSQVSALRAMTIYKEFIFDGGYYIPSGVQELPNTLVKKIIEYGGYVLLDTPVKKIIVQKNEVKGVITDKGDLFTARYIVSNSDAHHTFSKLIGRDNTPKALQTTLLNLKPSLSMFVLYLGTKNLISDFPSHATIWYLNDYDLEKLYKYHIEGATKDIKWFLGYYNPCEKTILCFFNVPYISKEYWKNNKHRLAELLIKKIDKVIPNTSNSICYKNIATPDTMLRMTSNYQGAAYGWAGSVDQFSIGGLSQATPIKNFFLTSHWTTSVQGIPGVAYLGGSTAKLILKKKYKRK